MKRENEAVDDDGRDCGKWTKEEDVLLKRAVDNIGAKNWKRISTEYLGGKRSDVQCLHRWQKVLKPGLIKGPWTKEEDETIMEAIKSGVTKWSEIATLIPGRIGKQCRERWFNHLDPSIKKGGWSEEEDRILVEYQEKLGNRWCEIAKVLPGRSENAVKNRWNSAMRRKFQQKRSKAGSAAKPGALTPSSVSSAKMNKAVRNNIRLPPEAILVEQPTNRNSVIAAREKIRRHQEQVENLQKNGGSGKISFLPHVNPQAMANATSAATLGAVAAAVAAAKAKSLQQQEQHQHQHQQQQQQQQQQQHLPQPPFFDNQPHLLGADLSLCKGQLQQQLSLGLERPALTTTPQMAPKHQIKTRLATGAVAQDPQSLGTSASSDSVSSAALRHGPGKKHQLTGARSASNVSSGENCGRASNKCSTSTTGKRPLSATGASGGTCGQGPPKQTKPPKKRMKRTGARLSKAVSNLLDRESFDVEVMKRKALSSLNLSDNDKMLLHQQVLALIDEANPTNANVNINMVWARLTEFVKKGGLTTGAIEPLPISVKASGSSSSSNSHKGKPRDLRVQCSSLDPSNWTLCGGTPVFGQGMTASTPVGEMLAMMPSLNGLHPSIFSPTPRHGSATFGCQTPMNQTSFPTPTAAEMKKIEQLDDPLFPDSIFYHMDTFNGLTGSATVLSPIFRHSGAVSSSVQTPRDTPLVSRD